MLIEKLKEGFSLALKPSVRTLTSLLYRVTLHLGSTVISLLMISIFKCYK